MNRTITAIADFDLLIPLAFAGAFAKHAKHSFDEHGISCRKYNSVTIFWTFPFFVDLTKTLLEMLDAWRSLFIPLFKLVILKDDAIWRRFCLIYYAIDS